MQIAFKILAAAFAVAAAVFLWRDDMDAAFATAVFGAVCFFLSIRFEVKKRLALRAADERAPSDDDDKQPQ